MSNFQMLKGTKFVSDFPEREVDMIQTGDLRTKPSNHFVFRQYNIRNFFGVPVQFRSISIETCGKM
jgi:hypothetical protein